MNWLQQERAGFLEFKLLRAAILATMLSNFSTDCLAGPREDANIAYNRGDYATALPLFRSLADQGLADAQSTLGTMYLNGQGVPQDFAVALTWYRKAADQGFALGQYGVAFMYSEGKGAPQDFTAALTWYRKAADQGLAVAQHAVANMYFYGQGVPKDFAAALTWYRKAADQGFGRSLNNLGWMYLQGIGVAQDYVQAYKLFNLAAARASDAETHDFAVKNRDYVVTKMSPAQVAEAQKLEAISGEWGPWPTSKDGRFVAAAFEHDDSGRLVVVCDTQKKLISILLNEPRASWKSGETMEWKTRSDDGRELKPSTGVVLGPTRIVVEEQSTFDLIIMGGSNNFFATGVGGYARIWPTANFKKSTEPVLRACGDHW